ncbi:MAG TPA: hypothetical protein VIJ27_05850 [Mucilaginibacter sp.]
MRKIVSVLTLTILVYLTGFTNSSFGQYFNTTTKYSKTNDGNIGQENYSFTFNNGTITITDLDYNRTENYEPVKLSESGFDENSYYYETYVPDIEKDPVNWRKFDNNIRNYKFIFDRKNGNLIIVIELKAKANNVRTTKIFYTQQGYTLTTTKSSSQNQNSSTFDLADILLNSPSLYEITNRIKGVYSTDGQKHFGDMATYSYQYRNGNNRAVISYKNLNDVLFQITFLMPKEEAIQISKASFISNFTQKVIDGNTIWTSLKTGLIYDVRENGDIGIIVVR